MSRLLYSQGKSPWHPLDRRLGGTQSWSERGGEEKNSQPQSGLELPIIQPVAQCCTTELSRLLYECIMFRKAFGSKMNEVRREALRFFTV
jgi:hypothetical protein